MNSKTKNLIKEKITSNEGRVTKEDFSYLEAIFPKNKIDKAIQTFFGISENLKQKVVLSGGNRLKVFFH
jgi:hypothetical protein